MPRFEKLRKAIVDATSGPRLVFHHVAKCGGTSVAQALRTRYVTSFSGFPTFPIYRAVQSLNPGLEELACANRVYELQEYMLLNYLHQDIRCIAGHVRFSNIAFRDFSDQYRFISIFRDPIDVMVSHFFFQQKMPSEIWNTEKRFEDYLEKPRVKQLGGMFSYYFSGLPSDSNPHSTTSIDAAKENLRRLSSIGFVDDLPKFEQRLRDTVGLKIKFGHANKSSVGDAERRATITRELRKKIEVCNETNIELFDFARRLI